MQERPINNPSNSPASLLKSIKIYLDGKSSEQEQKIAETNIRKTNLENIQSTHIIEALNIPNPTTRTIEKQCCILIELLQKKPDIHFISKEAGDFLAGLKYFEKGLHKVETEYLADARAFIKNKNKISKEKEIEKLAMFGKMIKGAKEVLNDPKSKTIEKEKVRKALISFEEGLISAEANIKQLTAAETTPALIKNVKAKIERLKKNIFIDPPLLLKAIEIYLDVKSLKKEICEEIIKMASLESIQLHHILYVLNIKEKATIEMAARHCYALIELLQKASRIRFKSKEVAALSFGIKHFEDALARVKVRTANTYDMEGLKQFKDDLAKAEVISSLIYKAKEKIHILRQNILVSDLVQKYGSLRPFCDKELKKHVSNFFEFEYALLHPFQYQVLLERSKVESVDWEEICNEKVQRAKNFLKEHFPESYSKLEEDELAGNLVFWYQRYLEKVSHPDSYCKPSMATAIVEQIEIVSQADFRKLFQFLASFAPISKKFNKICNDKILAVDYIKAFPDGGFPDRKLSQNDFANAFKNYFPSYYQYIKTTSYNRESPNWRNEFFNAKILFLTPREIELFRYIQTADREGIKKLNPSLEELFKCDYKNNDFFLMMLLHYRNGTYAQSTKEEKHCSVWAAEILRDVNALYGNKFNIQTTYHLFREFGKYTPSPKEKEEEKQQEQSLFVDAEQEEKQQEQSLFVDAEQEEKQQEQSLFVDAEQEEKQSIFVDVEKERYLIEKFNEIELKEQKTDFSAKEELQDQKKNPRGKMNSFIQEGERSPGEMPNHPPQVISLFTLAQNQSDAKPKEQNDKNNSALQDVSFFTQNNNKSRKDSIHEDKKKQKEPENKLSRERVISVFVSTSRIYMRWDNKIRDVACRSTDTIRSVKQKISGRNDEQHDDIVLVLNKIPIRAEFNDYTIEDIEQMRGSGQTVSEVQWFSEGPPPLIPNGRFLTQRIENEKGEFCIPAPYHEIQRYQPS
jgi:hypothetical protein